MCGKNEISCYRCVGHVIPHHVPGDRRRQAHDHVPGPQHRRDAHRTRREVPPHGPGPRSADADAQDPLRSRLHRFCDGLPLPSRPLFRCGMRHRGDDLRRMEEEREPVRLDDRHRGGRRAGALHIEVPPEPPVQMHVVQAGGRPRRRRDEGRHTQGPPQRPHERRIHLPYEPRRRLLRQRHLVHGGDRGAVRRKPCPHTSGDHAPRQQDKLPHLHGRRRPVRGHREARARRLRTPRGGPDKGGAGRGGRLRRTGDRRAHHSRPRQDGPRRGR